jgi:hypothetical protein
VPNAAVRTEKRLLDLVLCIFLAHSFKSLGFIVSGHMFQTMCWYSELIIGLVETFYSILFTFYP